LPFVVVVVVCAKPGAVVALFQVIILPVEAIRTVPEAPVIEMTVEATDPEPGPAERRQLIV
jgi:hypothetical protein